jgi:hypothetical protein
MMAVEQGSNEKNLLSQRVRGNRTYRENARAE